MGNKSDAEKSTVSDPENAGYKKVSGATEGIVRNFTNSKWERDGDPIIKDGTSSVNVKVYDGNGKLLTERNE